jgi:predicted DNA-binding antitoxin AbrB/MazE fold protein
MIHNIEAIFDHGVFRPVEPLALPEGARVHLRVEEENGEPIVEANHRVATLLSALDHAHNTEAIGSLKREELYDRDNLR